MMRYFFVPFLHLLLQFWMHTSFSCIKIIHHSFRQQKAHYLLRLCIVSNHYFGTGLPSLKITLLQFFIYLSRYCQKKICRKLKKQQFLTNYISPHGYHKCKQLFGQSLSNIIMGFQVGLETNLQFLTQNPLVHQYKLPR